MQDGIETRAGFYGGLFVEKPMENIPIDLSEMKREMDDEFFVRMMALRLQTTRATFLPLYIFYGLILGAELALLFGLLQHL